MENLKVRYTCLIWLIKAEIKILFRKNTYVDALNLYKDWDFIYKSDPIICLFVNNSFNY